MDPLLLEALRFGVAILAGGIVAVISVVLTYRYAERLRDRDRRAHESAMLRALRAEIEENLRRIDAENPTRLRPGRVKSSAWDLARELELPAALRQALADAYAAGDQLNGSLAVVDGFVAGSAGVAKDMDAQELVLRQSGHLLGGAEAEANTAHDAFEKARDALKPLV